jgi:glycosyltransferase involved in cell wall biosynthesis
MTNNRHALSVVIASVNGLPILEECLESLHQQSGVKGLEVIVANRCADGVGTVLRERYPWVKLIEAPSDTTLPKLRAMAFQESSGDLVAVLEDHCLVEPNWARQMIEAHRSEYPVIGGSIENAACEKLVDWAAFFCEYSQAMKPTREGEVDAIPGNNVSYKRWIFQRFQHDIEAGVWDFVLHEHIRKENIPLYSIPSITVYHKMSRSLGWFIVQKFHFARSFAGMRLARSSWIRHLLYGAGGVILPSVLAKRIISCVWKKGRHRLELIISLPILMLLLLSWGLGETIGYIFGPGSSSVKVS